MTFRSVVALLVLISISAFSQEWSSGLTDLQHSRTYPYVEKAFQLQQQKQYAAAAEQLKKALLIVPDHQPLISILFDAQLAIPDVDAAIITYRSLNQDSQQENVLRIVQTQLQLRQSLDLTAYKAIMPTLNSALQQQLNDTIVQVLIAQHQEQQAFDWLMQQHDLNNDMLMQRAILAEQLGLSQQVIRDIESLPLSTLNDTDWLRYSLALLQQGNAGKAASFANQQSNAAWSGRFYRQWLQQQLSAKNWAGAEQSFSWLQQHGALTKAEQQQRYQAAVEAGNAELAARYISIAESSCLQKVAMYLQVRDEQHAQQQFLQCPPEQNDNWLVYADRWLNAASLEAVKLSEPTLADRQTQLVRQKRIAEKDYPMLLKRLFAKPLQRKDYSLLVNSINALQDKQQQLHYFTVMNQTMPDAYLLDRRSYLLLELQRPEQALEMLLQAQPFSEQVMAQQVLPERLLNLLMQQSASPLPSQLARLNHWALYKDQRAELWRLAGECQQAIVLLDPKPDGYAGWQTLALCTNDKNPAAAIQYWQQAYQLRQDPAFLTQIAYQLRQLNQPDKALAQFQALPAAQLTPADILAMAELALQTNQLAQAEQYLVPATFSDNYLNAQRSAMLAEVYHRQQLPEQALLAWQQAVALQPEQISYQLAYAYALVAKAPAKALAMMQQLTAMPDFQPTAAQAAQIAYLHQTLQHEEATRLAVDNALSLYQQQAIDSPEALNTVFSLVRLQQQLSSNWQFSSSISLTNGAQDAQRLAVANAQPSKHGMATKAEYFFDPLQRDLSVYAVVAGNGNDAPWQNWGEQFGISYKPWQSVNLWATAGIEQYPFAEGNWQSLLRVSADILNAAPWQAEWRPTERSWWERKLYVDAVWWPQSGNRQAQLRYDQGPVWTLPGGMPQTFKWYGLAQFDYRRQAVTADKPVSGQQLAIGTGAQWRFWLGEAPVAVQKQRFEVNLEWQYRLAGDLNQRQHALLLQLFATW